MNTPIKSYREMISIKATDVVPPGESLWNHTGEIRIPSLDWNYTIQREYFVPKLNWFQSLVCKILRIEIVLQVNIKPSKIQHIVHKVLEANEQRIVKMRMSMGLPGCYWVHSKENPARALVWDKDKQKMRVLKVSDEE